MTKEPHTPRSSSLARIQQGMVITAAALILAAIALMARGHAAWGLALLVALTTGHAAAIALELALAARVNRADPLPRPTFAEWLHAWTQEVRVAVQVFAWRQPFRWARHPDHRTKAAAAHAPAVLIHGFVCNRGFWLPWMERMTRMGIAWTSVNLEPVFGSIDDYPDQIEDAVRRAEALSPAKPVLICHSMGGLAARAWLAADPRRRERVSKVITIGSPHAGTWLARFGHSPNGRQMRPGGPWLESLSAREHALRPQDTYAGFVCWVSTTDNIVFPASTATLPGADNRLIRGAGHVDLAFHPGVMAESLAMLASADSSPSERTCS
ncbi:esterase/lipase family protein [Hydrogenophaga sp. XSHU_21]